MPQMELLTFGGGWFMGGFELLDVAYNNMANITVATQTQLAITYVLKPPPFETTLYASPEEC